MKENNLMALEDIFMTKIKEANGETNEEKRKEKMQEALKIGEMLNKHEETFYQYWTTQDRIEKEEKKNEDMINLEKEKIKVPWQRTAIDVAKIVVPTVIPLILWRKSWKEMLRFEETGRFTSNASRTIHMPKIL